MSGRLGRALLAALAVAALAPSLGAQRARRPTRKSRRAEPERPAPPLVRLVVRDGALAASTSEVRAGLVRVRLVNRDTAWHDAVLVRLGDAGAAASDSVLAGAVAGPATTTPSGALEAGAPVAGGAALVAGGDSSEVALALEPGRWALVVRRDGARPGLATMLRVGARPAGDPRPAMRGGIAVSMADFRFDGGEELREGTQLLRVRNDGRRPHELVVYRMLSGRTLRDFGTWYTTTRTGPPPALPVGGAAMVAPGGEAWAVLHLRPGRYFMVCTVPEGKQLHAALGMVQAFEVP